jgi:hypothetical protein
MLASCLSLYETRKERARKLLGGEIGENRVVNLLNTMKIERLDGVVVTTEKGAKAQLDHILLGNQRFIVLETKNWTGTITGGPKDQEWLATRNSGEITPHRNPLFQVSRQSRLLKTVSGIPCVGFVIMAGNTQHETGHFVDDVIHITQLSKRLEVILKEAPLKGVRPIEEVKTAWNSIKATTKVPEAKKNLLRHSNTLNALVGPKPWLSWLAMSAVSASAANFLNTDTATMLARLASFL